MLSQLQQTYAQLSEVTFSQNEQGVVFVHINSELASATVSLHGAHVCHFLPKGEKPLLWMSESTPYQPGKAIRGGVPVCWPWFGPHPDGLPQHGFARTSRWLLSNIEKMSSGEVKVELLLRDSHESKEVWPHAFELTLSVVVGSELEMSLHTKNTGDSSFVIGGALHTYFAIEDISKTRIEGLSDTRFFSKVSGEDNLLQLGDVLIDQEVDRVYKETVSDCLIHDQGNARVIRVSKSGSKTTVVWNPWAELASNLADFDDEGYRQMVCIEAVNTGSDSYTLQPKETHILRQKVGISR